jgi:hypothetical protein
VHTSDAQKSGQIGVRTSYNGRKGRKRGSFGQSLNDELGKHFSSGVWQEKENRNNLLPSISIISLKTVFSIENNSFNGVQVFSIIRAKVFLRITR